MQRGAPARPSRLARFRAGLGAARAEKPFNIAAAVVAAAYTTLGVIAIALIGATINDRANDVVLLSALDAPPKPCGVAVPSLARLMYDFNAYRWSDVTELPVSDAGVLKTVQEHLCSSTDVDTALSQLWAGVKRDDFDGADPASVSLEVCNQTKVRNVPWKELQGEGHLDPRERLRRAYLRAQPAFYHFWPRFRSGGVCAGAANPLTEAACGADADGFLVTQLYHAASPLPLLGYKNALPTDGEMLVRLLLLGLVATWDYTENNNQCFQNGAAVADRKDAATFCADLYDAANNNAAAFPDLTASVSTSDGTTFTWPPAESSGDRYVLVPGCVDDYYASYTTRCVGEAGLVGSGSRPDLTSMLCEDNTVPPAPPGHLPPSPPSPPPAAAPDAATAHVRHCERALEISEAGVELLFGLPHIERGAHLMPVGGALTQFATFIYDATRGPWYDHQRMDNVRLSRQREAAMYTAYRLAVALFFVITSLCLLCYWLGRGVTMAAFILVPWALDTIIGGIGSKRERFRFDTFSRPPFSAVHIVVLVAAIVAYCFARFVDPLPAPGGLAPTCNMRGSTAGAWDTTTAKDTAVFHAANLLLLLAVISIVFELFFARGSGDLVGVTAAGRRKRRAASELVQLALVGGIAVGIVFQTLALVDVGHNWALKLQVADEANTNLGPLQLAATELKGDVLVVTYLAASQSTAFGVLMTRFAVKHLRAKFWILIWAAALAAAIVVGNLARNLHNQDLVTEALQPNQPYSHRQAAFIVGLITDIALGAFGGIAAWNEWRSMRRVHNTTLAAYRAQGGTNPNWRYQSTGAVAGSDADDERATLLKLERAGALVPMALAPFGAAAAAVGASPPDAPRRSPRIAAGVAPVDRVRVVGERFHP